MLGKMLIHGLMAAALVGSAAAVYAQAKDTGYLSPETAQAKSVGQGDSKLVGDNGYLRPTMAQASKHRDDDENYRSDRHRDRARFDRKRDHDDDD